MTMPQIVQDIALWWTVLMWGLGSALSTALLLLGLQWAAWKLVREIYGWPTIYRALREYREKHEPRGEDTP